MKDIENLKLKLQYSKELLEEAGLELLRITRAPKNQVAEDPILTIVKLNEDDRDTIFILSMTIAKVLKQDFVHINKLIDEIEREHGSREAKKSSHEGNELHEKDQAGRESVFTVVESSGDIEG